MDSKKYVFNIVRCGPNDALSHIRPDRKES